MNSQLLIICLIAHILGDYYLQTQELSTKKDNNYFFVVVHCLVYCIPFITFFLMAISSELFKVFMLLVSIHFAVDTIKHVLIRLNTNLKINPYLYIIDQLIHIFTVLLVCFYNQYVLYEPCAYINDFLKFLGVNTLLITKWLLLIISLYKPTNITFMKIFSLYRPNSVDTDSSAENTQQAITAAPDSTPQPVQLSNTTFFRQIFQPIIKLLNIAFPLSATRPEKKAGATIGFLERIIFVILIYISQYSAVGLVLTAKTLARYDKIAKDQAFAEYYLIGTLFSVLFSIVIFLLIF